MDYQEIATYLSNHQQWEKPGILWVSLHSFSVTEGSHIRWDYTHSPMCPVRIDVPAYVKPLDEYAQKIADLSKILGVELIDLTKSEEHDIGGAYSDEDIAIEATVTPKGHFTTFSLSDDWDNQWVIKGEGETWEKALYDLEKTALNWQRVSRLTLEFLNKKAGG